MHFPKDPNCDICLKTNNEGFLQKTCWYSRAQSRKLWWLNNCGSQNSQWSNESRNNYRHAVVVQDLATQWIQSYPCKTKTSQETQKSLQKFLEPNRKPKVIYTFNSWEFGEACEDLSWNHCTSTPHWSENKWDCWESGAQSERRYVCGTFAIRSGWKMVGRFYGMLYLSSKRHRFIIWWEDALWKTFWATI